jgi:hypothetical protein
VCARGYDKLEDSIERDGPVAQLGARFHGMEEVVSSNLTRSTKTISCTPRHFRPRVARNPGVANRDMALSKRFNVMGEKRYFQFRWRAYNAFNHTQYSSLNTTARFDPAGNQTNTLFGTVTATRTPASCRVRCGSPSERFTRRRETRGKTRRGTVH